MHLEWLGGLLLMLLAAHCWRMPSPYVDEVYHFGQVKRWLAGGIKLGSYDPMITTPPGLYLWAFPFLHIVHRELDDLQLLLLARGLGILLVLLVALCITGRHRWLLTHPLVMFYAPLFYTDAPAAALTLLHAECLAKRSIWAVPLAFAALSFRQTCIVWTTFSLVVAAHRAIPRHRKSAGIYKHMGAALRDKKRLAMSVAEVAGFLLLLMANGGIAIGDRVNHYLTLNPPQFLNCMLFCAVVCLPSLRLIRLFKRHFKPHHPLLITAIVLLLTKVYVHPYNLVDNRHLTFWFVRYVFARDFTRMLLAPCYLLALLSVYYSILDRRGPTMAVLFLMAAAVQTVTSSLLEPRYFMLPSIMLLMLIAPSQRLRRRQVAYNLALLALLELPFLCKELIV